MDHGALPGFDLLKSCSTCILLNASYAIRPILWLYSITVPMETRTTAALAAIVPAQVIVIVPKSGDAALNSVWKNTLINTQPLPDIR